ncbi:MAG: ATP-binding protein [Fibrobacteria bacterium]
MIPIPMPGGSASRLTAIIEAIPTALIMIDRRGAIVMVNREAENVFGYSREEFLSLGIESLVPEKFRGNHPALREGFHGNPQARRMGIGRDLYTLRKDGSEFPVEIGLNPIESDSERYVLSAIVDITDRKRMEAALRELNEELEKRVHDRTAELARANEAMERSNIELKQFAYIASHDLQAPLRSISGFVQLLKQDYGAKLDGQAEEWIRRTVESTQYMQTLIKDLLSYSQVDSRARPFSGIDCGHAFDEAVAMLDGSIRDSGATVTRDALPTVLGDRSQLVQLFMNLVSNGIKYHGVEPPRVHASARLTDEKWTITLRDNGIGIAPKHHERIFEIFQRLHTRRAYPGTGIGLAVCRRVVEHHGGSIGVDSSPGQGAAFHFTIPDRKDVNP